MKYFLLEENKKCVHKPVVSNWYTATKKQGIDIKKFHSIKDKVLLNLVSDKEIVVTSVLTHPLFMIHDSILNIVQKYEPNMPSKKIILLDSENGFFELYHMPLLTYIDCMDIEKSVPNKAGGSYEKIVLDESKMQGLNKKSIFWIMGDESKVPIISLDIAESILRRDWRGLQLTEVEVTAIS